MGPFGKDLRGPCVRHGKPELRSPRATDGYYCRSGRFLVKKREYLSEHDSERERNTEPNERDDEERPHGASLARKSGDCQPSEGDEAKDDGDRQNEPHGVMLLSVARRIQAKVSSSS
jgi:hypothetical protein